jgi:hypothetical protein
MKKKRRTRRISMESSGKTSARTSNLELLKTLPTDLNLLSFSGKYLLPRIL